MNERGRYLIVGGAGFLGSHFADRLLAIEATEAVTVYDNFSSGREWHVSHQGDDKRFTLIRADAKDPKSLADAMTGHQTVIHLAANPDIARAVTDPDIDFREGTALTRNVLEAMRLTDCRQILYASGSGVYGDLGDAEAIEDQGGMRPISTYGASKLACESLISAYCHMFELSGYSFRFGNVVGARQTHGVGFDFVRKLLNDGTRLDILGNGEQSKSYIHVDDTVSAVLHAADHANGGCNVFNVATGDYITVKEIADMAVDCVGLKENDVDYRYSGGDRGWKGDVPVVRLSTERIRNLGWECRHTSRDAIKKSLVALLEEAQSGATS